MLLSALAHWLILAPGLNLFFNRVQKFKAEKQQRKKELKRQIGGMPKQQQSLRKTVRPLRRGEQRKQPRVANGGFPHPPRATLSLLQNFESEEERRYKAERSKLEETYKVGPALRPCCLASLRAAPSHRRSFA